MFCFVLFFKEKEAVGRFAVYSSLYYGIVNYGKPHISPPTMSFYLISPILSKYTFPRSYPSINKTVTMLGRWIMHVQFKCS